MVRTRFAPSPTGYMHIGNLRTALYEYLIAKSNKGKFILRIEDTDQARFVEDATALIYKALKITGLQHDEGPDIGGAYGPYIQSERKGIYMDYALKLVEEKKAYYCFCTVERLESLHNQSALGIAKYDRHCMNLLDEEIAENLKNNIPYVIRQVIPEGKTTFYDEVYGEITIDNTELDDQVLIKSDGLPTYNFANVVDDHLMEITHVVRGSEYISSTPKYNLLYNAFGWEIPTYIHLPLIVKTDGSKISKRKGDASFEDLLNMGYLPEAIINYIALLGWSPGDNREIFSLKELEEAFNVKGLSKSPSAFDMDKLKWVNGEYIKKMNFDDFYEMTENLLKENVKTEGIEYKELAKMAQSRISTINEAPDLFDFIDKLPEYSTDLYMHKKMKTDKENSLASLKKVLELFSGMNENWTNDYIYESLMALVNEMGVKNGIILWPVRTALSGKPSSPCGASELAELLGKEESIKRIKKGIALLEVQN